MKFIGDRNFKFIRDDNAWGDSFFDELERRKNMSDPLVDDYYNSRSGLEKIKMPGSSDKDAYDLLHKIATQLDRWASQPYEEGWSKPHLNLANEIYDFLKKKGK
jgi:hypothetical protein